MQDKTKYVTFRINEAHLTEIDKLAQIAGMNRSQIIRNLLEEAREGIRTKTATLAETNTS